MRLGFSAKRLYHNRTGLGNYSRNLVGSLSDLYPNNNYVLFNPKEKKIHFKNRINTKEVLPIGFWKRLPSVWMQTSILRQIKEERLDIFHGLSGDIPIGIHKIGIKTIVTIHDLIFMRYPKLYSPIDRKIYEAKFRYAIKSADRVIAISQQTKKDIIHFFKTPENKIDVIYQGCDNAFKHIIAIEEREKVLKKYNIKGNYILNVGTIEERKNVLTIVKGIEKLNIKLIIIGGQTNYTNKVRQFVKQKKMSDRVFFLSGLSFHELICFYQSAKIFVYPSLFEGFGIPIIEAIYSKVPVIAAKGSCLEEAGGPYTRYIDPFDFNTLSEQITTLLGAPSEAKKQVEKSLTFATCFENNKIASLYHSLYTGLLG